MAREKRDLEAAKQTLAVWWSERSDRPVEIAEISVPKAGFSNETLVGIANVGGELLDFVARVEPTSHQLFLEPSAAFQASMMKPIAGTGRVPVPVVLAEEEDASVLGAPFFLMRHVEGRIPPDRPSWHEGGWATELSISDRARLYDNGLAALVALHSIAPGEDFHFLARPGVGGPFDAYLDHVTDWYEWSRPVLISGADTIATALDFVRAERPGDVDEVCVTWGDARVGNIIFDDALNVAAVLDWEGAALGPAGIDLGWWLMFEQFFCEAAGVPRLEGIPNRDATIERYEMLGGRAIFDLRYYEILAALVFALINNRLAHLAITEYGAPGTGPLRPSCRNA